MLSHRWASRGSARPHPQRSSGEMRDPSAVNPTMSDCIKHPGSKLHATMSPTLAPSVDDL